MNTNHCHFPFLKDFVLEKNSQDLRPDDLLLVDGEKLKNIKHLNNVKYFKVVKICETGVAFGPYRTIHTTGLYVSNLFITEKPVSSHSYFFGLKKSYSKEKHTVIEYYDKQDSVVFEDGVIMTDFFRDQKIKILINKEKLITMLSFIDEHSK